MQTIRRFKFFEIQIKFATLILLCYFVGEESNCFSRTTRRKIKTEDDEFVIRIDSLSSIETPRFTSLLIDISCSSPRVSLLFFAITTAKALPPSSLPLSSILFFIHILSRPSEYTAGAKESRERQRGRNRKQSQY